MASNLTELCKNIQICAEKIEEEIKKNIDDCHKLLLSNEATETKLALEKAKDYHYKEILDYLKQIVMNIKKIIFHEEKIRNLDDEKSLSLDELRRYSHVQRQISIFSNFGEVTKREKRRVASEVSIGTLEAWEQYLQKKAEGEKGIQVEKSEIPKRKRPNSRRRRKKFVSSTFNNFLDDRNGCRRLDSILEGSQEDLHIDDKFSGEKNLESDGEHEIGDNDKIIEEENGVDDINFGSHSEDERSDDMKQQRVCNKSEDKYSVPNIVESINKELCLEVQEDTKPKIVDVVYKKKVK